MDTIFNIFFYLIRFFPFFFFFLVSNVSKFGELFLPLSHIEHVHANFIVNRWLSVWWNSRSSLFYQSLQRWGVREKGGMRSLLMLRKQCIYSDVLTIFRIMLNGKIENLIPFFFSFLFFSFLFFNFCFWLFFFVFFIFFSYFLIRKNILNICKWVCSIYNSYFSTFRKLILQECKRYWTQQLNFISYLLPAKINLKK